MIQQEQVMIMTFILAGTIFAQGLFESAAGFSDKSEDRPIDLNGHLRAAVYGGKVPDVNEGEIKNVFAEAALKLRIPKLPFGDAFGELRVRGGYEYDEWTGTVDLREAYLNAYVGRFDFTMGKRIIVWGRADGVNPTNNVTPQNFFARSADEDGRREGNLLVRGIVNLQPVRIEAIWVPVYMPSETPVHYVSFPDRIFAEVLPGVTLILPVDIAPVAYDNPDANLKNGAGAGRVSLELGPIDGSVSYFNGYYPMPGLNVRTDPDLSPLLSLDLSDPAALASLMTDPLIAALLGDTISVTPVLTAYRVHTAGIDFSTTIGSLFGLRGEAAFRYSRDDYDDPDNLHVPNPDLQYVLGMDKEIGNVTLLGQYAGRYVIDFKPIDKSNPLYDLYLKNRMLAFQADQFSHSAFARIGWRLLNETLSLELAGMYNFTTREILLRSKITYDISDAFRVSLGGEAFTGPEESMYGLIEEEMNAVFVELKAAF